jgi:hypothetical protein
MGGNAETADADAGALALRRVKARGALREKKGLGGVGLRSTAAPSLLPTCTCNLLDKVIINVRIGDDLATPPIGVAENDLDCLLVVRDLPL